MTRPLSEILTAMKALADHCDPEVAHSDADELLIEALLRLAADSPVVGVMLDVMEITNAYRCVDKWHA